MKNNVYTSKFRIQKANTYLLRGPLIRDNSVVFLWYFRDSATSLSHAESTFSAPHAPLTSLLQWIPHPSHFSAELITNWSA